MVSWPENYSRFKEYFRFSPQEIIGLIVAGIATGFIFSFRDWGNDSFSLILGLTHLVTASGIAIFSFFFRVSSQKLFSLTQGYRAEFNVWYTGIIIALVIAFITFGTIPLILIGAISLSFITRQRLGEFRYGFSYAENGVAALWSVWSGLILAIFFAFGLHFAPESYFFKKGLLINLIMSFCALFPLPQLEGLQSFWGKRGFYYLAILAVVTAAVLLLSNTTAGLIITIIGGVIIGFIFIAKGSEK